MIVYRCSLRKWANDLTGTGSFLHGGRWNTPGTRLLYTAENNVLAAFEVALRIPLDQISKNYVMIPIDIPDDAETYAPRLPKNWNIDVRFTQHIGDEFVKGRRDLLMKVPSALITDSYNYLINPAHPLIANVKPGEPRTILFDKRLSEMIREK
ncbi:MAG: RES family NAD+ phosphorylase [Bacteroidota bacterium]|nr:RES family NAD+ phosphorylase [Bacteroidota bacterium]